MYREMTDKEKLDFTSEIITAMQYGGFSAVLKLIEEKKEELNDNISNEINYEEKQDKDFFIEEIKDRKENNNVIEEIKDKNEIENEKEKIVQEEHENNIINEHEEDNLLSSDGASIYSKEALPLVKKDLEEHGSKKEEVIIEDREETITPITENNIEEINVYKENNEEEYLEDEQVIDEPFDKAPVLERKLTNNNPWSGIETVAPGTLKL